MKYIVYFLYLFFFSPPRTGIYFWNFSLDIYEMIWDLSNIVIHCILGWADSVGIICDTTFKFGLNEYIIKISIKNVCNDVQVINSFQFLVLIHGL